MPGFYLNTIAEVEKAWLRYVADKQSYSMLNNQKVQAEEMGGYWRADVTDLVKAVETNGLSLLRME